MAEKKEAQATAAPKPKKAEQKTCFVIGPIGESDGETRRKADWLLKGIVKPVLENEHGYHVVRADEIAKPGMINSQVMDLVLSADLAVADLTGENANAFYELAMRHMNEKPTIHLAESGQKIPFDVSGFRTIFYSISDFDGVESAKSELSEYVKNMKSSDFTVDNPIVSARGAIKLKNTASDTERTLFNMLDGVVRRITSLEMGQSTPMLAGHIEGAIKVRYLYKHSREERKKIIGEVLECVKWFDINTGGVMGSEDGIEIIILPPNAKDDIVHFIEWFGHQTWAASVQHNLF